MAKAAPSALDEDAAFFAHIARFRVGAVLAEGDELGMTSAQDYWVHGPESRDTQLHNAGFVRREAGDFERLAPLSELFVPLVPTHAPMLRQVGAIAMISIDRQDGQVPYIYATLRSSFAALPPEAQINVLVGDERADYLAKDTLRDAIGQSWAERVHVHTTPADSARFMRGHLDLRQRGGWNWARALRSHSEPTSLMLLEDDVLWYSRDMAHLDTLVSPAYPFISLYNTLCRLVPARVALGTVPFELVDETQQNERFQCTQGIIVSGHYTRALGDFVQRRVHKEAPYDHLADQFFRARGIRPAWIYPSLLQHAGRSTTGLAGGGFFHDSDCVLDRR